MAHTLQAESALVSSNLKTTSLIVAECFGKRHDNVVRAIEALEIPEEYRLLNFEERVREVSHGSGANREYRAYEMTRDGFALLVMGFTGKRAMHWKIRFLEAFNAMEAELRTSSAHYHQSNNGLNRLTGYLDVLLLDESMMSAEWMALDRVRKITRELSKQEKGMKE